MCSMPGVAKRLVTISKLKVQSRCNHGISTAADPLSVICVSAEKLLQRSNHQLVRCIDTFVIYSAGKTADAASAPHDILFQNCHADAVVKAQSPLFLVVARYTLESIPSNGNLLPVSHPGLTSVVSVAKDASSGSPVEMEAPALAASSAHRRRGLPGGVR